MTRRGKTPPADGKEPAGKPGTPAHAESKSEATSDSEARKAPRIGAPLPAYARDPDYLKALSHYQTAEWENCLQALDHLLKSHPDDRDLLTFKDDVLGRLELQQRTEKQRNADNRSRRRKVGRRATIAVLSVLVLAIVVGWFVNAYQVEETRQRVAASATQTAIALAGKDAMAGTFMKAGRAEQALALYREIRQVDPAYKDIDDSVSRAEQAIRIEEMYQEAQAAIRSGDKKSALASLESVSESQPEYKDTSQLIASLSRDLKIEALVEAMDQAYSQGDSAGVVENFEAIQEIDPLIELPDMEEKLFFSYQDLVLQIAARPDPTLEEIQSAARYYRKASALFPQSRAYARERDELQEVAVELVASQYYLQGIGLLESSDYSIDGLEQSILVLERAREKAPNSVIVDAAIEKSQLFIDSYEDLVRGGWDSAITGLSDLYGRDPDFGEGRARFFLYTALATRGDLLMLNADFGGAFTDYQSAETLAFADEENLLPLFEIEVRVAAALRKLGQYDEAAEFYHYAFDQVDFEKRLTEPAQQDLLDVLLSAESAYNEGNALTAIGFYEEAMDGIGVMYDTVTIAAYRGDTLPNLAFENGSTLASLRRVNELGDSLILGRSRELLVPVLPPVGP